MGQQRKDLINLAAILRVERFLTTEYLFCARSLKNSAPSFAAEVCFLSTLKAG
jgi:hypothetical protein